MLKFVCNFLSKISVTIWEFPFYISYDISFSYGFKFNICRSNIFYFIYLNIHSQVVLLSITRISNSIFVCIFLIFVFYQWAIIHIFIPFSNHYMTQIINNSDRIFYSVSVYIIITYISYSISICIYLTRIIIIWTIIVCIY